MDPSLSGMPGMPAPPGAEAQAQAPVSPDFENRIAALEQRLTVLESTLGLGGELGSDAGLDMDLESEESEKSPPVQSAGEIPEFGRMAAASPRTPFRKIMPPPPRTPGGRKGAESASPGRPKR